VASTGYIGEEETYKVYRDSMTDSQGGTCRSTPRSRSTARTSSSQAQSAKGASPIERAELPADDGAAGRDRKGDAAVIIDCHGHYTTAPKPLQAYRDAQIAGLKDPSHVQTKGVVANNRRRDPREPRGRATEAAARARHRRDDFLAAGVGDGAPRRRRDDQPALVAALQRPDRARLRAVSKNFVGVCQLPQSPSVPPARSICELEALRQRARLHRLQPEPRSVGRPLDVAAADRSVVVSALREDGGARRSAMVHVSSSCNPNFHATGAHYINADTTAFMQFLTADLFKDFPALRFVIPHGGGAVAVSLGPLPRPRAGHEAAAARRSDSHNVFFDTCVYHLPGIELLVKVVPADNILFGSEMVAPSAASTRRPASTSTTRSAISTR